jgi:hypothetical protein
MGTLIGLFKSGWVRRNIRSPITDKAAAKKKKPGYDLFAAI